MRYVFDIQEDCNGKEAKPEEIVAKLRQVDVLGLAGASHGGRNPPDRGERMRLYSLRLMQTEVTDIHGNVRNSRKPNRL